MRKLVRATTWRSLLKTATIIGWSIPILVSSFLWWHFQRRPSSLFKKHHRRNMQASMELNAIVSENFKQQFGRYPSTEERDAFMQEYLKWKSIQTTNRFMTEIDEN